MTTDFGYTDEYVGVVKGVIMSINPSAQIIDLTHAIPPQDIQRAAVLIGRNRRYFPNGSIHLCIVDPGVGTDRRIIAVRGRTQYFIGPDNGVFSSIMESGETLEIHQVSNRSWFLEGLSGTFHGRDIMAPAAARISSGEAIENVGPRLDRKSCIIITPAAPLCKRDEIIGEVMTIDHFGNLITNIKQKHLQTLPEKALIAVQVKSASVAFQRCSYDDLADERPAAIINSSDLVEICVKKGSAAEALQVRDGETVVVKAIIS